MAMEAADSQWTELKVYQLLSSDQTNKSISWLNMALNSLGIVCLVLLEYWRILEDMACYTGPRLAPKLDGVGLIDNRPSSD